MKDCNQKKASEIIKEKLENCEGQCATVYTLQGKPCKISTSEDDSKFNCDKWRPCNNYDYKVFDAIIDLLKRNGGTAIKGNGRNFRLGDPKCSEDTVVGTVAKHIGRKKGDSVPDPVFVLAAVLNWAGLVENQRGKLVLKTQ